MHIYVRSKISKFLFSVICPNGLFFFHSINSVMEEDRSFSENHGKNRNKILNRVLEEAKFSVIIGISFRLSF